LTLRGDNIGVSPPHHHLFSIWCCFISPVVIVWNVFGSRDLKRVGASFSFLLRPFCWVMAAVEAVRAVSKNPGLGRFDLTHICSFFKIVILFALVCCLYVTVVWLERAWRAQINLSGLGLLWAVFIAPLRSWMCFVTCLLS